MKYLIVIPTYNEKDNIFNLVEIIQKELMGNFDFSIMIVDDNSTDGTKKILYIRVRKIN